MKPLRHLVSTAMTNQKSPQIQTLRLEYHDRHRVVKNLRQKTQTLDVAVDILSQYFKEMDKLLRAITLDKIVFVPFCKKGLLLKERICSLLKQIVSI